jgi:hypothetical protein
MTEWCADVAPSAGHTCHRHWGPVPGTWALEEHTAVQLGLREKERWLPVA